MEKSSSASEQYVPEIGHVVRMAPKLNEWASMAAHSYGLYSGINAAISRAHDKSAPIVTHADHLRTETALLCIVRLFATIDRDSQISLQSVNRFLKLPNSPHELATAYAASNDRAQIEAAMKACKAGIDRFNKYYSTIDWNAIGRMQSFRNSAIAHITWGEVRKFVTHGELETLVEIVGRLAGETTLMTSGLNNWPHEHQEIAHDDAKHKWDAIFAADHRDVIDY